MPPIVHSRRAVLAGLAAVLLARPASAYAAGEVKTIGYLSGGQGPDGIARFMAPFGYVVGRNLRVEIRIPPDWDAATLARAAAQLVALRPDVLHAFHHNRVAALAAATRTIPIVCGGVPDPVGAGFASSLRRPGGNITGLSLGLSEVAEIALGLMKAVRPELKRVALVSAAGAPAYDESNSARGAARKAGVETVLVTIGSEAEAERELAPFAEQALFVAPFRDVALGKKVLAIANRRRIVTMGPVADGALMAYGLDFANSEGRIGAILDQVLRGANPAEIPFELPSQPRFALNRTTARAIGVQIPHEVMLRVTLLVD